MKWDGMALGMLETMGMPALIAAADAAAKAADVRVAAYEKADAGIVTVYVLGDVAPCKRRWTRARPRRAKLAGCWPAASFRAPTAALWIFLIERSERAG
ncbi:BMC domain-containing protein [Gordoniibacillus kamchatkensis]